MEAEKKLGGAARDQSNAPPAMIGTATSSAPNATKLSGHAAGVKKKLRSSSKKSDKAGYPPVWKPTATAVLDPLQPSNEIRGPALVGYARVSTAEQETHLQRRALTAAGVLEIYEEKRSGADRRRPVLRQVLDRLQPGDTLVVFKLDRVARSLRHLLEVLADLEARSIGFRSVTESIDTTTPAGRLMMQMMGAFAEFERELIRERTRHGMRAAVERGVRLGRPTAIPRDLFPKVIQEFKQGDSRSQLARRYGCHLSSIKRVLRAHEITRRLWNSPTKEVHHEAA